MFPKWSDWNLEYTRKGLLKKQAKRALGILLLLSVIVGAYFLRKEGSSMYGSLQSYIHLLRRHLKQGLVSVWGLVNRAITMLPE